MKARIPSHLRFFNTAANDTVLSWCMEMTSQSPRVRTNLPAPRNNPIPQSLWGFIHIPTRRIYPSQSYRHIEPWIAAPAAHYILNILSSINMASIQNRQRVAVSLAPTIDDFPESHRGRRFLNAHLAQHTLFPQDMDDGPPLESCGYEMLMANRNQYESGCFFNT